MSISNEMRNFVFKRDEYTCKYCGRILDEHTALVEHVTPLSQGGNNDVANLVTSCGKCNVSKADNFIKSATNPISMNIAKIWIRAYQRYHSLTKFITVILMFILTVTIPLWTLDIASRETDDISSMDFQSQIAQLEQTEENLTQLLSFVSEQRERIQDAEGVIAELEAEQVALEPLVESNRQVVEAIFRAQDSRNRTSLVKERWIGFILGIIASIFASTILILVRYFVARKRIVSPSL